MSPRPGVPVDRPAPSAPRRWWLVVAVAAGFVPLLAALEPVRAVAWGWDRSWHRWMVQLEWPVAVTAAHVLAVVGGVWVSATLRVAVALWLGLRRRWGWLAVWLTSIVLSELAITVLKGVVERGRPPMSLETTSTSSFPSGHAVATAVTAVTLAAMAAHAGDRRWPWALAAVVVTAMAVSRTYLRVHWLTDVIAGSLLGAALGLVCIGVARRQEPQR